jgi:type IV secretion system protein VirB10
VNPNTSPELDAPAPGNPYSARLQQPAPPDLDAGAPELRTAELRRMNRRALAFLATIVVLLAAAALWMFNSAINSRDSRPKPREERVSIPEAPKAPLLPPPPRPAEAIAVTPTLPPLSAQLPPPLPLAPQGPHQPTLVERRMQSAQSAAAVGVDYGGGNASMASPQFPGAAPGGPFGAAAAEPAVPPNSAYTMKPLAATSSAQPLLRPDTLMLRGTYIRCVLETHIVTDIPGFTSCVVTEPVYSFSGKRLLLPKGSKVLGKYSMEPNGPRVAVIWDRIVTPTGIDVNMASPGVDNLGGAGHPGFLDEHWGVRIGSAMLISLFSDAFKYVAAEHGPSSSTIGASGVVVQSPYESNTARTLQDLANQAVRRSANRPATVTIHQGTVINVYVARDVDFSGVVARY